MATTKNTYVTFLWDDTMVWGDGSWNDAEEIELEPSRIPVCGILIKETKKYLLLGLCLKEGCTVGNAVQFPKSAISNLKRHTFPSTGNKKAQDKEIVLDNKPNMW